MNIGKRIFENLRQRPALLTIIANNGRTLSFTLTSLISVPLALRHLSVEEFGFWAFTSQSIGYFLLFDFGIAMAVSRLMAGPLTRGEPTEANRWFTLLLMLAAIQGILIWMVGWLSVDVLLRWFNVSDALFETARTVWLWMLTMAIIGFGVRVISGILYAQNRFYWGSFGGAFGAWGGFGAFLFFLWTGKGLMAFAYAAAVQTVFLISFTLLGVWRGRYRFRPDFSRLNHSRIRQIYGFSSSLFVSSVANSIITHGPTLIVTKLFGLEGAAGFNVSTKVILTARILLWQMFESYLPGWQQLYIQNRIHELLQSWRVRFDLMLSSTFVVATASIAANQWFVSWWAKPELHQGFGLDLAGAIFCVATMWVWGVGFAPVFAMRPWARSLLHFVAAGITVILGIPLTKTFGSEGVLWAAAAGYMFGLGWYCQFSFRKLLVERAPESTPPPPRRFLPLAALCIVVAGACTWYGQPSGWIVFVPPLAGGILFFALWKELLRDLVLRRRPPSGFGPEAPAENPPSPM